MDDVRELDFETLVESSGAILEEYDKPDVETPPQRLARINRIMDEMPQVYRWFLQLNSWCEHWTAAQAKMFGMRDHRTQNIRQRRDLMKDLASAAKLQYEGASRAVTIMQEFGPDGMPRSRSG